MKSSKSALATSNFFTVTAFLSLTALLIGASSAQAQAVRVCEGRDKKVFVHAQNVKNVFRVEVVTGGRVFTVSRDARVGSDRQSLIGHVTEQTDLAKDGSFQLRAPLTLKANQFIVQDPNTGSATVNWDKLRCVDN